MKKKQSARATSSKAVADFIEDAAPSEATLEGIRNKLREARDLADHIQSLEDLVGEKRKSFQHIKHEELPDMFASAGVDSIGLPAEGNHPAYDCKLSPFYRATIPVSWPDERRQQAFDFIEEHGDGDLIKHEYKIVLAKDDVKKRQELEKFLNKNKLDYDVQKTVPWQTLTAWIRELIEKRNAILPLDKLGATVGMVVNSKPRKG